MKTGSLVFCHDSKNEWEEVVEEHPPAKTKEETTNSHRATHVGAPATVGTFASTSLRKMRVVELDLLPSRTPRDERP
jgi:hypothetical protein